MQVHDHDPAQHLDLWLATTTSDNFGRLCVRPEARTSGRVNPAMRWGGASLYTGGTIAYIAARALSDQVNELGVIAHGPDSSTLAAHASDLLHRWDRERPTHPTITAHRGTTPSDHSHSAALIVRPHTRLSVEW